MLTVERKRGKCEICYNNNKKLDLKEQLSIECHKTKTEVITLANQKRHRLSNEPVKSKRGKTSASESDVTVGFGFTDWFWLYSSLLPIG